MIPFSLMVSRTIPSLPSILLFFFGSNDIAYTSASMDLSAIRLPITLQALSSVSDGNVYLRSLAFVLATDITLLVPRCITFACTNRFEKKTSSKNGLMYISVLCFHDFLLGLFAASPRDLLVQAAWMKEFCKHNQGILELFSKFLYRFELVLIWRSMWYWSEPNSHLDILIHLVMMGFGQR